MASCFSRSVFSVFVAVLSTVSQAWASGTDLDRAASAAASTENGNAADPRDRLEASFFLGYSIDTFAAGDLKRYLNPEAANGLQERFVGGFDFAYRLVDAAGIGTPGKTGALWLYAETIHGMRSTTVDCAENPDTPVCKPLQNTVSAGQQTLYILRKATSLEGFLGARWEFFPIHMESDAPARLYVKTQLGFLTVTGIGDDLIDNHHGAFGLIVTSGTYRDSYLEFGRGINDLFPLRPNRRYKLDALLSWRNKGLMSLGARPFAQITVDSDLGGDSDSIQTYVGFDFDLDDFLGLDSLFGGSDKGQIRGVDGAGKP